jgi:hypothetical protein
MSAHPVDYPLHLHWSTAVQYAQPAAVCHPEGSHLLLQPHGQVVERAQGGCVHLIHFLTLISLLNVLVGVPVLQAGRAPCGQGSCQKGIHDGLNTPGSKGACQIAYKNILDAMLYAACILQSQGLCQSWCCTGSHTHVAQATHRPQVVALLPPCTSTPPGISCILHVCTHMVCHLGLDRRLAPLHAPDAPGQVLHAGVPLCLGLAGACRALGLRVGAGINIMTVISRLEQLSLQWCSTAVVMSERGAGPAGGSGYVWVCMGVYAYETVQVEAQLAVPAPALTAACCVLQCAVRAYQPPVSKRGAGEVV